MSTEPLKYGLPLRPATASTALWARILRQDTQPSSTSLSDIPSIVPPTVPLDKNATSMRVLLHDTQANFENFAIHVGKLIDGVNETKHEIKTTNNLFERDRETLVGDIIDLVNRSQKEIQKSVGSPCQTTSTETYFKDVNHRLDALDQRLDAIQAFNQTHSQALQTQIQAIQILLDKQGTIVSAVLPLLPLIQAVPLHIEAARNTLNETISKLTLTQKFTSDSPNQSVAIKVTGKRKQSQKSPSSSPLLESPSKRRNLTGNVLKDARPTNRVQTSQEKSDVTSSVHQLHLFELSSSLTLKSNGPHQKSSPLTHPADTLTSSLSRRNTFVLPNFSTPRKPLSDLPVQPFRQTSVRGGNLNTLVCGNSVPRSNTISQPSPPVLLEITPTAARPPRMLRVHGSISNSMRNLPMEPLKTSTTSGPMNLNKSDTLTSSGPDVSTAYKVPSLSPSPAPFLPSRMNYSAMGDPQDEPTMTSQNEPATLDTPTHVMPPPNLPLDSCAIARAKGNVVPTAVALGNMKATPASWIVLSSIGLFLRFVQRIGRRFIPLVDSEDEDEGQ